METSRGPRNVRYNPNDNDFNRKMVGTHSILARMQMVGWLYNPSGGQEPIMLQSSPQEPPNGVDDAKVFLTCPM